MSLAGSNPVIVIRIDPSKLLLASQIVMGSAVPHANFASILESEVYVEENLPD